MKRKILACVLACMTLFLGFGYAAWTDSLQINGDVDTGELAVKFVDARNFATLAESGDPEFYNGNPIKDGWVVYTGIPEYERFAAQYFADYDYNAFSGDTALFESLIEDYTQTLSEIERVTTGSIGVGYDDNYGVPVAATVHEGIDITVNKIYPGYAQLFKTDILNTGTLAAKLTDIDVELTGETPDDSVLDMIGVALDVYDEDNNRIVNVFKNLVEDDQYFVFKGVKFIRLSALDDITPGNLGDLLYIYPSDDNTMDVVFGVAMDPDWDGDYTTGRVTENGVVNAANTDADSQNGEAAFKINFKWDQMNATGSMPEVDDDDDEPDLN